MTNLAIPVKMFPVKMSPESVSKQNRNRTSKIEVIINKALIGPWAKLVPLRFLGSEKMNDLQPNAKNKKLTAGNRKANRKHEQQQFSASYWSAQPRQNITSGPPYTASYPQLARQHSRTDTRKQPAGEPQHQPRRSRAFVSRRSSLSEHSLRKIEDDTPENEVGSSFSV